MPQEEILLRPSTLKQADLHIGDKESGIIVALLLSFDTTCCRAERRRQRQTYQNFLI